MKKWISLVVVGLPLMGCSGGGGGGGGGGAGTTSSLMQTSKMACNGAVCMGGGSLSLMNVDDILKPQAVTTAVGLYNQFNQSVIPAFNNLISNIEAGVKAGGATSCADINLGFNGTVTANGVNYEATTAASSATANGSYFSTTNMTKRLAARVSGGANYMTADVNCGAESDASPLVARVISTDGTNRLNAWFERGSTAHVRILLVAQYSGVKYAGWFKTDDGDNYEFAFASAGGIFRGIGNKTGNWVNYQDNAGVSLTCMNATTGATTSGCSGTPPTPPTIANDLLGSSMSDWSTIGSATLATPSYP